MACLYLPRAESRFPPSSVLTLPEGLKGPVLPCQAHVQYVLCLFLSSYSKSFPMPTPIWVLSHAELLRIQAALPRSSRGTGLGLRNPRLRGPSRVCGYKLPGLTLTPPPAVALRKFNFSGPGSSFGKRVV